MLALAQLITLAGALALLGKGGWDYYNGGKDVGRNLIIGLLVLGLALFLVVNEIATGSTSGMIGALARLGTAVLNSVAMSFEASATGVLPTLVPTVVATVAP